MAPLAQMHTSDQALANLPYLLPQHFDPPRKSNVPVVSLIGGGISQEQSLMALLREEGWQFERFASAQEFLAQPQLVVPSCVLLALPLREMDELEEQKLLSRERADVPIVIISRHADVPKTVEAMKAGAIDFLLDPFSAPLLLGAIRESLERSRSTMERESEIRNLRSCYESLSRRERQVMTFVVAGLLNKQVAAELGISEITVKAHRAQVMQKMKADSFATLVRMAAKLESDS